MLGYLGTVIEQWSVRLGLEEAVVSELVGRQPALLEMSPTTVKARLVRQAGRGCAAGYDGVVTAAKR